LISRNPELDFARVRSNLALIVERGFARGEKLSDKLDSLIAETDEA
jgi:hypothetical protein